MAKVNDKNEENGSGLVPTAESVVADTSDKNTELAANGSVIYNKDLDKKIKQAFKNFPTADRLYTDGKEVYFSEIKPKMTVIARVDYQTKNSK